MFDRTALRGVANLVTFNAARPGRATMNGNDGEAFGYFVGDGESRQSTVVINICLPMATRTVSLVGSSLARRIEVECEQHGLNQVVLLTARYRKDHSPRDRRW
jgi:hypothetical protein